jgi:tetratricopeptide (TPR) repeat protein
MQEALKRAMAENPELAKEFEETLARRVRDGITCYLYSEVHHPCFDVMTNLLRLLLQLSQAEAIEEKERGNRLFSEKKHEEAIKSFTKCIALDPK